MSAHRTRLPRALRWGRTFLSGLVLLALLAPLLPLGSPARPHLDARLEAPTLEDAWRAGARAEDFPVDDPASLALRDLRFAVFGGGHLGPLLGTDALGRDLLARLVYGARVSLAVAAVASLVGLVLGVLWGGLAGLFGGRLDTVLMRAVDVLHALPLVFLVIFVVAALRGLRQENPEDAPSQLAVLFVVIGAVSWLPLARVVRAKTATVVATPFVEAAIAGGATRTRLFTRHLIPHVLPVVFVSLTLTVPRILLLEAFLSFLGLGVEPPGVSWGLLARQGFDATTAVHVSWWLVAFPALAFALTLLALNLLGDALRDALDPRLGPRRAR